MCIKEDKERKIQTTREERPCTYLAEDQNMIHTRPFAHEKNVENMNRIFFRFCAPILVSTGNGTYNKEMFSGKTQVRRLTKMIKNKTKWTQM